jgi:hypothetical protein
VAVISCTRQRGVTARYSGPATHEYTDKYRIVCDQQMARSQVLLESLNGAPDALPDLYDTHEEYGVIDASSYCQSVDLTQSNEHACLWEAAVQFGPMPPNTSPSDNVTSPELRPTRFRIEWIDQQGILIKDRLGSPIVNSVGDEFDVPLEEPELFMVLVADRNYLTLQGVIDLGLQYHGTVNSATFFGGQPRTVKFLPIQASDVQYERGIAYYTASLRFAYNPKTWDREVLNRGWRYRAVAAGAIRKAIDPVTKLPTSQPLNLATDGTLVPDGQPPVYLKFEANVLANYNNITL